MFCFSLKRGMVKPILAALRRVVLLLPLPLVMALPGAGMALAEGAEAWRGFAAGDIVIRGRLMALVPYNQKTSIDVIGGHVDTQTMITPDVDASIFLTDVLSVTGQVGVVKTKITIRDSLYGDIEVGSVRSIPLTLAAQYHVAPIWGVRPYFGAGMVANWYFDEKPAGGHVQDFTVTSQYAPLLKVGLDYQIAENWFLNLEVKQIFFPTQTLQNQGLRSRTSLDTVSIGVGLGYRF